MESTSTKVVKASESGFHSYDPGELKAFIEFINDSLKNDTDVKKYLPFQNEMDLTSASKNGIMLCKLINAVAPETIDERTINKQEPLNIYKMDENLKLAINAAASIGCRIVNISPSSIRDGQLHLIMGMIWQIMRIYLLERINIKSNPGIILLAEEGETTKDIMQLSGEKILVRWLRYELVQAGQEPKVKEINSELKDLVVFSHVMSQLDKEFDKTVIEEGSVEKRAKALIESSKKLKVKSFITEEALMEGNPKIYLMFTSLLFNSKNDLELSEDKKVEVQKSTLSEEVVTTGTKEERTFQLWVNSLGLEGIYINNFYSDLKDGLVILRLMNYVWPGSVVEGKYEKKPGNNTYKQIANCNYAINVGSTVKIKTGGLTGKGLAESNPTQVLGLLWQIMRANYLQIIEGATEEDLISWGNAIADYKPPIKNFKDPGFKSSKFLLSLMSKLDPGIVDWDFVSAGEKDEEIELNAKYCINIARKLGAKIFITWEDIKNVNSKMLTVFLAAIKNLFNERHKSIQPASKKAKEEKAAPKVEESEQPKTEEAQGGDTKPEDPTKAEEKVEEENQDEKKE